MHHSVTGLDALYITGNQSEAQKVLFADLFHSINKNIQFNDLSSCTYISLDLDKLVDYCGVYAPKLGGPLGEGCILLYRLLIASPHLKQLIDLT